MPELPEVETLKRQMEQEIVGEAIGELLVREEKIVVGERELVIGKKITNVARRGKYLFVFFGDGTGLQVHLKMTGRLVIRQSEDSENQNNQRARESEIDYETAPHTRVVIVFESGRKIYYWDTRKFGYLKIEKDIKAAEEKVKGKLGKEPWEMTEKELYTKLKRTGRAVKEAVLDQNLIAGVGNIYANDALWKAGVDPRRAGKRITKAEASKILASIREVMERSLTIGGASDNTFRDLYGKTGRYQNEFLVYGKTKGKCPKCGGDLIYVKVSGRGTWYCHACQV